MLDRLLGALDVSVEAFAVCDLRTGTSLDLASEGTVEIHYVLRGTGRVEMASRPSIPFSPNCVVIVPPGLGHRIVPDEPGDVLASGAVCVQPSEGIALLQRGELDAAQTLLMVCGTVRARIEGGVDLFRELKEPLSVDCSGVASVEAAFHTMLREQAAPGPGSQTLVSIGMTTVFIHVLRQLCDEEGGRLTWLAALSDERLASALGEMVDHPEAAHSVDRLATAAGMSRSAFAEHFAKTFGITPMDMLRELRVRRAAHLLRSSDLPVKLVADQVGYASRSQFSKAFKALMGTDPSSYRADSHAH